MCATPANPQKFAVTVAASPIARVGVFAAEPIPPYKKIGEIRGEAISIAESRRRVKGVERIMMIEISDKRAIDASKSEDPMRYTNHSCSPNTVLRINRGRVEFYSMRAIPAGAELTANYGETHHAGKLTCRCGAPNCVGKL
jgi:SET domain-containing protein